MSRYKITVMDQYSPAYVTVSAYQSSEILDIFPGNGTRVVANRVYTITVSVISEEGRSYPSNPVVVSKLSCMSSFRDQQILIYVWYLRMPIT